MVFIIDIDVRGETYPLVITKSGVRRPLFRLIKLFLLKLEFFKLQVVSCVAIFGGRALDSRVTAWDLKMKPKSRVQVVLLVS
jgi:hypothetical protein